MAFKLPPITVLPGGRKVRDYDHLTVEYAEEQKAKPKTAEEWTKAQEGKPLPEPTRPDPAPRKKPAKATGMVEDESLG